MAKKARGTIYRQKKSPYYYISWYVNGKQYKESTKTTDLKEAQKKLSEKTIANAVPDKRLISALLDGLIADYVNNHRKAIEWVKIVVEAHLRPYFGTMKIDALKKATVLEYIEKRRKLGRANSTINKEVTLLRRAFSLGDVQFPRISTLKENNVRKNFVTPENYFAIVQHLPKHLLPIFQFAYTTGCRRGEILNLKWSNVDLRNSEVRLEVGETKNDEGRTIPLSTDLVAMFEGMPHQSEYVFAKNGKRILSTKDAWKKACEAAGLPDMHFHDSRRTAVRNLVRAGVPETVAMSISGHKTRSIFDRYNIVSGSDQREAMVKLEAAQTTLERQAQQKLPGQMDNFLVSTEPKEKKKKSI